MLVRISVPFTFAFKIHFLLLFLLLIFFNKFFLFPYNALYSSHSEEASARRPAGARGQSRVLVLFAESKLRRVFDCVRWPRFIRCHVGAKLGVCVCVECVPPRRK